MEVVLILAVLAGAIYLWLRAGKSHEIDLPRDDWTRPSPSRPVRRSTRSTWNEPEPFDATNAEHVAGNRILIGPAWVTDGDTIKIKNIQVRLFGIDAPELNHPYGKNAKWALHRMCKGHVIRAEITDEDDHGRTVARCYLPDGRDLSAEMVKQGMAIDWPKFSGGEYKRLETPDARRKLFLADARQKGRMHVWEKFEARQAKK